MATYKIPEENLNWLEDEIEKLSRKAEKLGCSPISMEILSEEMVETETEDADGYKVKGNAVKVFTVEVIGESPMLNGWKFVAKLEHLGGKNVVRGMEEVPEIYRTADPNCDHCQTQRDRNNTYVVRKGNEYKQVGSSCVADFTGHKNAQALAELAEMIVEFFASVGSQEYDPDRAYSSPYFSIRAYLAFVAKNVREHGYISKSKARDDFTLSPTAETALTNMLNVGRYDWTYPIEKDGELASAALDWIRAHSLENLNDYMHNLITICEDDYMEIRHMGYVASLIATYKRTLEQEQEKKNSKPSNWIGEIKKRQTFNNLTVLKVTPHDGFYGMTYITRFQDEDGNILVWFATNGTEYEIGDVVSGKATVKNHDEYRGIKQTIINRCKFELVEA